MKIAVITTSSESVLHPALSPIGWHWVQTKKEPRPAISSLISSVVSAGIDRIVFALPPGCAAANMIPSIVEDGKEFGLAISFVFSSSGETGRLHAAISQNPRSDHIVLSCDTLYVPSKVVTKALEKTMEYQDEASLVIVGKAGTIRVSEKQEVVNLSQAKIKDAILGIPAKTNEFFFDFSASVGHDASADVFIEALVKAGKTVKMVSPLEMSAVHPIEFSKPPVMT